MRLPLDVLASVLVEYASEFTGCDGCDGTFDAEFTEMRSYAAYDGLTFCPVCVERDEEQYHDSLLDPRD